MAENLNEEAVLDADVAASGSDTTVYEVGYLLVPTIAEEEVAAKVSELRETIDKLGAVVISDEHPKLTELAYTMEKDIANRKEKFNHAYFGWVKFDLEPGAVEKLKTELERNTSIVRFLIVKTVRENTLASKRPLGFKKRTRKDEAAGEEMNKEEVDKQIDALVTEEPAAQA